MIYYCKLGCRRRVKSRRSLCAKCSRKMITDNGLGKENGNIVYGLYDDHSKLVYIGITNSATRRVAQHIDLKHFKRMEVISRFNTRKEAIAFEAFAIDSLRPPLNRKIEKIPDDYIFTAKDLQAFGEVATIGLTAKEFKTGRKCQKCDTVLSSYNRTELCRVHLNSPIPKGREKGKKRKNA